MTLARLYPPNYLYTTTRRCSYMLLTRSTFSLVGWRKDAYREPKHQSSTIYQPIQDLQYFPQARPKHTPAPNPPPNSQYQSQVPFPPPIIPLRSIPTQPINQAHAHSCKSGDQALRAQPSALASGGSSGRGGGICCRSCCGVA
jgi:hypothetical protein